MKIGFVFDDSLDRPDGVQQYVTTLGRWLKNGGHEVHYLVGATKRTDLDNVHSLGKNTRVSFNKNRLTVPRSVSNKHLKDLIDRLDLDVLHVQLPYSPFLGGRVIQNAPQRTVLVGTFHILPGSKSSALGTKVLGLIQNQSLKQFDVTIAVSPPSAEFAKNEYKVDCIVIPNMVDMSLFRNSEANGSALTSIVFLGRLVERKGCAQLLKAISLLRQSNNKAQFKVLIGGQGPLESSLKKYTHKMK